MASAPRSVDPKNIKIMKRHDSVANLEIKSSDKTVKAVVTVERKNEKSYLPDMPTSSALSVIDEPLDYERIIRKFIGGSSVIRGKNGRNYLRKDDRGNDYHVRVGSNHANLF
jgi:hypothetical protein